MEIINNKEYRLRQAILNGSSKKLQQYFKDKEQLDGKLINAYENTYKFMNFNLTIKLEQIKDIHNVVKNLLETANFTVDSNIPLAEVINDLNRTSVCLNYCYNADKFILTFKNEELEKIENIEPDETFKDFIEDITQGKLTAFLKSCLYKYNVEDKKEF